MKNHLSRKRGRFWRLQANMLAILGLLTLITTFSGIEPASADTGTNTKPVPVQPPSVGQTTKPQTPGTQAPQTLIGLPWTVNLTASPTSLWPTQYSTLTATANRNVGPTPYWLRIYDLTGHMYVATCGSGTVCSTSVTQPTATTHRYVAVIAYYTSAYPPSGQQAISAQVPVTWRSISVSLNANPTTLRPGSTTTLTANTSADVGPTPFYTQIFDTTTGTRIAVCGSGTTCTATSRQTYATTHRFVAYVSRYGTTLPPPSVQATSNASFVTWTWSGYRVSLYAPASTFGSETVTAYTNINVGPTPYWIQIFDLNGTRVGVCGSGTSCAVSYTPSFLGSKLVAFVSSYSTALPPPNIQASSNVVSTIRRFPIVSGGVTSAS